jgi:ADP-ribose pyrophosphatase
MNRPSLVSAGRAKTIFEGRIFRVEQQPVTLADGRSAVMDIVRHRGSVVLIPRPDTRHVILIRQYRHVIGQTIWELPAGSLEAGEAPARAARRECVEETGWRPRSVKRLGMYFPSPGFCDERMIFYQCSDLVKPRGPVHQDPDEQIEPRIVTLREAWALVRAGAVVDMKTVLGLALVSKRVPQVVPR